MLNDTLKSMSVQMPIQVNPYDIDFGGVVSNIVYIRWLEDMRIKFLDTYYPLESQVKKGFAPIVVETRAYYKRPLKLFSKPIGFLWVKHLGRVKYVIGAEISENNQLVFEAEQSGCFAELSTGRPIHVPEDFYEKYKLFTLGT